MKENMLPECLVELHVHLDGSISVDSAKKLAAMQHIAIPSDDETLRGMLEANDCNDLNEVLARFEFPNRLLQTKEGLTAAVVNLLDEMKEDGVMYAEIRFAPQLSTKEGLTQEDAVRAVLDGVRASAAGVLCGIILCCMRGADTRENNLETVRIAAKYAGKGVCAVDLAGAEALYPTALHSEELTLARKMGLNLTIHAGEAAGAESVRAALSQGAKRIGHGVRAIEDESLVKLLAEKKIPLEVAPTSNILTRAYPTMDAHPLRKLLDAGVRVTVSTDDRSVCHTTLQNEFSLLRKTFDLTDGDIRAMLMNAADAAFADEATKDGLRAAIDSYFHKRQA